MPQPNSDGFAIGNAYRDSYGYRNTDTDSNANSDGHVHAHTYGDSDGYGNAYSDANGYGYVHADSYSDGDCHSYGHRHANADADANSHSYRDGDTNTDSNADSHSYGHGDGDSAAAAHSDDHAQTYTDAQAAADASSAGALIGGNSREKPREFPKGGSSCPEDDGRGVVEGADIRRQEPHYFANALRTTRSTFVLSLGWIGFSEDDGKSIVEGARTCGKAPIPSSFSSSVSSANRADGIGEIEGKAAREAASECG